MGKQDEGIGRAGDPTQKVPLCGRARLQHLPASCVTFPRRAETSNVFTGTTNLARRLLAAPHPSAKTIAMLAGLDCLCVLVKEDSGF